MYEDVKKTLKDSGEVMITMDSGKTFELHTHNTKFHDDKEVISVDTGTEHYWLNGNKIEHYWIHRGI